MAHGRLLLIGTILLAAPVAMAEARPATGILDNSFLVEEAYNQEPGIVQHIVTLEWAVNRVGGPDDRAWSPAFTQEWPLFGQTHQIAYSIPYTFQESGGQSDNGIGDIELNYRLQLFGETNTRPAVAPSFTLSLPTGDDEGLVAGEWGYSLNLPVSKILADRWTGHFNVGISIVPDVRGHDLTCYNLGASLIYAATSTVNIMLEWAGNWDTGVDNFGNRARSFAAVISPGIRCAINFAEGQQMVLGVAAPIGLNSAASDFGAVLYFSFEHVFRAAD